MAKIPKYAFAYLKVLLTSDKYDIHISTEILLLIFSGERVEVH